MIENAGIDDRDGDAAATGAEIPRGGSIHARERPLLLEQGIGRNTMGDHARAGRHSELQNRFRTFSRSRSRSVIDAVCARATTRTEPIVRSSVTATPAAAAMRGNAAAISAPSANRISSLRPVAFVSFDAFVGTCSSEVTSAHSTVRSLRKRLASCCSDTASRGAPSARFQCPYGLRRPHSRAHLPAPRAAFELRPGTRRRVPRRG